MRDLLFFVLGLTLIVAISDPERAGEAIHKFVAAARGTDCTATEVPSGD